MSPKSSILFEHPKRTTDESASATNLFFMSLIFKFNDLNELECYSDIQTNTSNTWELTVLTKRWRYF
jgi:hypothetical protein